MMMMIGFKSVRALHETLRSTFYRMFKLFAESLITKSVISVGFRVEPAQIMFLRPCSVMSGNMFKSFQALSL